MSSVAGFRLRFRPYWRQDAAPNCPGGSMKSFKQITTAALMLHLGVAGVYAQQKSVKMTFSGTAESSLFNLAAGANSSEDNSAGDGTLGSFTFRDLAAELPSS